jgi:hypothetical protein
MTNRPLKELWKPSRRDAIKHLVAGTAALGVLSGRRGLAPVPSPGELERAHPVTQTWQLARPAKAREIEGYASQPSVNRGETIELFAQPGPILQSVGTDVPFDRGYPENRFPDDPE